jgi:Replication initiator protein A
MMGNARENEPDLEPPPVELIGRDEMNLAEFPIALLTDYAPKEQKTVRFEDGNGTLLITGSDAYGLPTAADADVIVALMQLTKIKNGFTQATVQFSRGDLLKILNWPDTGKYYKRLSESLYRWAATTLHYQGIWWDNKSKRRINVLMHILETVVLYDRADSQGQGTLPLSSFTWNNAFMESCQADNLKRLDIAEYFSLNFSASKRLYRFLDKRFYRRLDLLFALEEIAFERVGMSRCYAGNTAKIKERLQPAIEELEAIGFLVPLGKKERYQKDGTTWMVRFIRKHKAPALPSPAPQEPSAEPEDPPLVAQLVARDVTRARAVELVNQHPAAAVEAKIEVFDWLVEKKDKRVSKSPGGWLVKAIEDGYAVPKGFESKADRERKAQAGRERQRQADEERRRRMEEEARTQAESEAIDRYWVALTPQQQTELDEAARSLADPATLAGEITPALKRMGTTIRRREYIRRILQQQGAVAPKQDTSALLF